jgi:tetratricopeptide (TPR) repeat protein
MEKSVLTFASNVKTGGAGDMDNLDRLIKKALKLYLDENLEEAEKLLTRALDKSDSPKTRVRLAQVRLSAGNAVGALELVMPLVGGDSFMAELMAVRSYLALGRETEMEHHLEKLVELVDGMLSANRRKLSEDHREYVGLLLQQLGMINRHRQVLELYKRWQPYVLDWDVRYFAAVASFNMGRFKQAAAHWSAIGEVPLAMNMQYVAVLVERGTIPPFDLEYMFPDRDMIERLAEEFSSLDPQQLPGIVRMAFLGMVVDEEAEEEDVLELLMPLVLGLDDWGAALGLGLLESSIIRGPVKMAAVQLLVQAGVLPEDHPIPVTVDDETMMVTVTRREQPIKSSDLDHLINRLTFNYKEESRMAVEHKRLSPDSALLRGLKNMPSIWLDAICSFFELEPARYRKDREKQIAKFLSTPGGVYLAVQKLSDEEQELLRYVLDSGGWVRIGNVTRKFGSMEGDAYFWPEEEPETTLARLWRTALVMVGTTTIGKQNVRIVTVPADIRESVRDILSGVVPSELPVMPPRAKDREQQAPQPHAEECSDDVYELKVTLDGTYPPVWRKIAVPAAFTFWELHVAIQDAMGWEDRHLHSFFVRNKEGRKVRIGIPQEGLFEGGDGMLPGWEESIRRYFSRKGSNIRYVYDFGDDWLHIIELDNIASIEKDAVYPACIGGELACPPEDCGGVYGYRKLLAKEELDLGDFDCSAVKFSDAGMRLAKFRQQ